MKLTDELKQRITEESEKYLENINSPEGEYGSLIEEQRTELGAFYTPPQLCIQMLEMLDTTLEEFAYKSLIDPTCGSGNLLMAALIVGSSINNKYPELLFGNDINESALHIFRQRIAFYCKEYNMDYDYSYWKEKVTNKDALKLSNLVKERKFVINKLKEHVAYDFLLANPPYKIGEKIIEGTTHIANQSVVLMPFGKYKKSKQELYKYVDKAVQVNRFNFADKGQDIQPNLLICHLTPEKVDTRNLLDLEKQVWDPEYVDYYVRNISTPTNVLNRTYCTKDEKFVRENIKRILFIPYWSHVGNAQSDRSVTKWANLGDSFYIERILKTNQSYNYLVFESSEERNNAFEFWKTNLCNQLIFGSSTRNTLEKFPHLDWRRSWTENEVLEYVLQKQL